jgi:hypothetical protein
MTDKAESRKPRAGRRLQVLSASAPYRGDGPVGFYTDLIQALNGVQGKMPRVREVEGEQILTTDPNHLTDAELGGQPPMSRLVNFRWRVFV